MTAMLAFCRCGHLRDEHVAGGGCIHLNRSAKLGTEGHLCSCVRYEPDERLTDSEAFVGRVIAKACAKENLPLEQVDREDLMQVLRIALWKTSAKYDSRSHVAFRVYAYLELYNDAIDHIRSNWGRHGQHRVFDARHITLDDAFSDGDPGADRLGDAAAGGTQDDSHDWLADGGGLLVVGDRGRARQDGGVGPRAGGRDEAGDHRAGVRASRRVGAARPGARRPARRPYVDCVSCGWRTYTSQPGGIPGWVEPTTCADCGADLQEASS